MIIYDHIIVGFNNTAIYLAKKLLSQNQSVLLICEENFVSTRLNQSLAWEDLIQTAGNYQAVKELGLEDKSLQKIRQDLLKNFSSKFQEIENNFYQEEKEKLKKYRSCTVLEGLVELQKGKKIELAGDQKTWIFGYKKIVFTDIQEPKEIVLKNFKSQNISSLRDLSELNLLQNKVSILGENWDSFAIAFALSKLDFEVDIITSQCKEDLRFFDPTFLDLLVSVQKQNKINIFYETHIQSFKKLKDKIYLSDENGEKIITNNLYIQPSLLVKDYGWKNIAIKVEKWKNKSSNFYAGKKVFIANSLDYNFLDKYVKLSLSKLNFNGSLNKHRNLRIFRFDEGFQLGLSEQEIRKAYRFRARFLLHRKNEKSFIKVAYITPSQKVLGIVVSGEYAQQNYFFVTNLGKLKLTDVKKLLS